MESIACNSAMQLGSREWIGVVKATIDSVAAVIAEPTSGFFAILYIVFSFFLMVLCEPFGWARLLSDSNRALFAVLS